MFEQKLFNLDYFDNGKWAELYSEAKNFLASYVMPPALSICERSDDIDAVKKLLPNGYKRYLILGTGGSSLAGQVMKSVFGTDRLYFFDNVDPDSFFAPFLTDCAALIVISKSGETLETLVQLSAIIDKFNANDILIITEDKDSRLRRISQRLGTKFFPHPSDIGGRFSAFSVVGALPCLLSGGDPTLLRRGALGLISSGLDEVARSAATLAMCSGPGSQINIMSLISYSDVLRPILEWIVQLVSESLGKGGIGVTPTCSSGTVYQHSMLQLFLDGKKDKYFNVFSVKNRQTEVGDGAVVVKRGRAATIRVDSVSSAFVNYDLALDQGLAGLAVSGMRQAFEAERVAALKVLTDSGAPIREFVVDSLNEDSLGGFFAHFMLETIVCAHLLNINPFDQPAVEKIKTLLKGCFV